MTARHRSAGGCSEPRSTRGLTVQCVECGEYFWPTAREVFAWTVCAHCAGWWTFDGNPRPR